MKKFLGFIKNKIKKFWETITNKWLLKGTTTLILVAIVIACYFGINLLAEYAKVEDLDFTTKKLYSLSDDTKERLKNLENEITIQLINMKDYVYRDTYGNVLVDGSYVIEYANKYSTASKNIKVEEINDLDTRNDLQNEYNITSADAIVVVKNGDNKSVVTVNKLVTIDYSTYKFIDTTEEAITNAIMEVTIKEKPKVYVFNGNTLINAEQSLYFVATTLQSEANDVELLDILTTGKVPEDCDCLIITTLSKDLTNMERDEILKYINNGGNILMLTSQCKLTEDTPNLDQVLAQYGITLDYGVVYEQDSSKKLAEAPNMIFTEARASFMDNIDMGLRMFLIEAGNIKFADSTELEKLGVTYEVIASTSESSFVRSDFNQKSQSRTDKDSEEGSYIVGAYACKETTDEINSKLIIYSDELFASTESVNIIGDFAWYICNNEDVVLNSVSHLTEREDTIKIRKSGEAEIYKVTDQEDIVIKTIIFTLPFLIIMIGISVGVYRKRKA